MTTDAELYEALKYNITVMSDGTKYYTLAGVLHREGNPAVEYADGGNCWFQNGELHRTDGPAIVRPNNNCEWYLYNVQYTEPEYRARLKQLGHKHDH